MIILALLVGAAFPTADGLLARSEGARVQDLLAPAHRPMEQRDLDVAGAPGRERVVLVGRPDPAGTLVAVGLVVCARRSGRWHALGATRFTWNPAYETVLSEVQADLDGDGLVDPAVDERAAGGGIRVEGTSFYRLAAGKLAVIHRSVRRFEGRGRSVHRTLRIVPGRIVETVAETGQGASTLDSVIEITLVWDRPRGRFAPARTRVIR